MRKIILGAAIFTMACGFAGFENMEITNFTGSYNKPDGTATASKLLIPESTSSTINIKVEGFGNGYLLYYGDKEFHLENPPSFINDLNSANWSGINYQTTNTKMNTSFELFKSDITGTRTNIKGLKANCTINRDHSGAYGLQLLDACLTNSSFRVGSFLSSKLANIYNILIDLPGIEGISSSEISMSNASLDVSRNSFNFKGRVDLGVSANIKISGKSNYDITRNRVVIKVEKAKASFINIKNKLFEELEKSETETLQIQNPYIYIYLK